MNRNKEKSELGRQLAALRHLSLTPERRREIAKKASLASVKARKKKVAVDNSLTDK